MTWTGVSQAWMFLAALYIIIAPLVEEVNFLPGNLSRVGSLNRDANADSENH